jgi:hypothetical protein
MAAVIGYLVAASIAIAAGLRVAGPHHVVRRDPTFAIADVSARHVPILGALAAFAITGLVFLVTQARNVPDPSGTSFTTVVAMFVVAYLAYFSSSLLFAHVSNPTEERTFDLAAAQYAGASVSLLFVFLGWFALVPLFETFELTRISDLVGWLLIGALIPGYAQVSTALYRSGYASVRVAVLLPLFAGVAVLAYGVLIGVLAPDLRSPETALILTHVAFIVGVAGYAGHTILPIAAHREPLASTLANRWHLAVIAYAEATMVLIGFLLLSVLGLV